jgi:IS30 family transposase
VRRFSEAEKALIWDRRREGVGMRTVARELGRAHGSVRTMVEDHGGVRPHPRVRSSWHLSLVEREEISRGMAAGESLRSIAARLGRSASTVSREVARNGGRFRYRAHRADQAAWNRARRPKVCKLAANPALALMVEEKLGLWWSPQQISGWLKESYPETPVMWVSHETIYLSLFVQGRGALKHELTQCLRTHRAIRRPTKKRAPTGKGQI